MALDTLVAMGSIRVPRASAVDGSAGADAASALRVALPPFVVGKLIGLLIPVFTVWSRTDAPGRPAYAVLVQPFANWDGDAYRHIAEKGYPGGPLDLIPGHPGHFWGFFPGYPLLVRTMSAVIHDTVTAGIAVSAVGELIALVYLARLLLLEVGDAESARFGTWLLALYPYAVFLSALYTESVFLAAATASLYYMRRGDTLTASATAAIAMATRITGLALIPALVLDHLLRRRFRPGPELLAVGAALLPIAAFMWHARRLTGDALAYQHVEESASFGNRTLTFPPIGWWHTVEAATSGGASSTTFVFWLEVLFGTAGFLALILLALGWRRIAPSLTLFAAGVWVLGASLSYWLSMPRYEMAMVPVFVAAAMLTRRRAHWRQPIIALSCAWMAFDATVLGTGSFAG